MSLSSLYEDKHGEYGLYSLLKTFFVANEVTNAQRSVVRFPWKQIYTTNYDNVVDTCLSEIGTKHSIHTTSQKVSDVDSRVLPIIHINGYIQSASFSNYRKEVKLTEVQYFSDDFSRSAWGERFRTDIITSPFIVFVG
ncbi:SIR2 family protein [Lichenifustis flavocetrariae]|uniref:SIR2 family protein n=1 Tax=Lichenifustis flavocetrariae TaxID=2949735 RepID=UPI003D0F2053